MIPALCAIAPLVGPFVILELWTRWRRRHDR